MKLKYIFDEVFQDYKKASMLLATCMCDWKCSVDGNFNKNICQNSELSRQNDIDISIETIIDRYINNPITNAIIIAGLEPFLQFDEVLQFIQQFREKSDDDIVIYTGYYPNEVESEVSRLKQYKNIIIKFGRYISNRNKQYDETLGIWLASDNQFAKKIS